MTLGDLMNWGGFARAPAAPSIERYHSGPSSYWEHKYHGHSGKSSGKGGGRSAALSALTLLAFLFLINVMQQSLQDNNSTIPAVPVPTTLLLRESQQQVSLRSRTAIDVTNDPQEQENVGFTDDKPKGDILSRDFT